MLSENVISTDLNENETEFGLHFALGHIHIYEMVTQLK